MAGNITVVRSPTHFIEQNCFDEFTYPVTSPRGRVLLINNQDFDTPTQSDQRKLKHRSGSDVDCDRLEALFNQLDFIVNVQENVSSKFMLELLEKETRCEDQDQYGMFVLIILSHGDSTGIYGTDGRPIFYNDIYKRLSARSFRTMREKPKLLIFQACFGSQQENKTLKVAADSTCEEVEEEDDLETPSYQSQSTDISPNSDLFILRSSFPGHKSYLHETKGAVMIQALIEIFEQFSCRYSLDMLANKIRSIVYDKCKKDEEAFKKYGFQTIFHSSTLTKGLFFFPGYDPTKPLPTESQPKPNPAQKPASQKKETKTVTTKPKATTKEAPVTKSVSAILPEGTGPFPKSLEPLYVFAGKIRCSINAAEYFDRRLKYVGSHGITGFGGKVMKSQDARANLDNLNFESIVKDPEDSNKVYLLVTRKEESQRMVLKMEADTRVCREIYRYNTQSTTNNYITTTSEYIVITDSVEGLKILSRSKYSHQFDIPLPGAWGVVALSNDTVIVSSMEGGSVCHMSLEQNPKTFWKVNDVKQATGIAVKEDAGYIIVGKYDGDLLYIITLKGELLPPLTIQYPRKGMLDLSIRDDQVSACSGRHGILKLALQF